MSVAPVFAGEALQVWKCELHDDATEEQVKEAAKTWLTAARKVKGGENLEAFVFFPVAVSNTGQMDLLFVVRTPTFKEWGRFWDGYADSEAAKLDEKHKKFIFPTDSNLWEFKKVKAPGGKDTPATVKKALQMWKCELDDDATEKQVMEAAGNWLAAARKIKGAKNLEAFIFFPVAVNDTGQLDLMFVVTAPTFEALGDFWDGYADSEAAKLDDKHKELIIAPDSAIWEAIKVSVAK